MTEEKICPLMSRPQQGKTIHNETDLKECIENDWYIIGNQIPWDNIFYCQREKCMAWVEPGKIRYPDYNPNGRIVGFVESDREGFCKLIVRD